MYVCTYVLCTYVCTNVCIMDVCLCVFICQNFSKITDNFLDQNS